MPVDPPRPVTREVAELVEEFVRGELRKAGQEDRGPLDESGIFSLHLMVAKAYGFGFRDGEYVQFLRHQSQVHREVSGG